MASKIKGITVEIGGNTGPLQKALDDVNKSSRDLESELKQVNKQLRFDPNNTVLLQQKQKLLAEAISNTKDKLATLKEAEKQVQKQFEEGKIGEEQYRALQREITKTENDLKSLESQAFKCSSTLQKISEVNNKIGETAGKVSSKMMPLTLGLVAVGTASSELGIDLIESMNKVEVACGSGAEEVKAFAKTTLENFGIAEGSALEMAALFSDMGTGMGLETEAANKMSMSLVGLAADLASYKNVKLDVAKTALNSIYTGETESLKQLGIVMTQANLNEFARQQGIEKTIDKMTQAEQVQLRYAYVMDKTKNAQGDFVRNSDEAANSTRIATETFKEAGATVGVMLAPIIAKAAQYVSELVKNFINLDDNQKKMIVTILAVIAAIAPVAKIIQGISVITGVCTTVISTITGAFSLYTGAVATASTASTVLAKVMTFMTGPIGIVIAILGALVAAFIYFWNTSDKFREFWINLGEKIKEVASKLSDFLVEFFTVIIPESIVKLKDFISSIPGFIINIIEKIKLKISSVFTEIKVFISDTLVKIKEIFITVITIITNFVIEHFDWGISAIKTIFEGIKLYFSGAWEIIKNIFLGAILFIIDLVTGNFTQLKTDAANILNNLQYSLSTIWEGIKTIFKGALDFILGYLSAVWNQILNVVITIGNAFKDFFVALWQAISEGISFAWNGFKNTIVDICISIYNKVISIWNEVVKFFINLPSTLYNLGVNIFTSLKNGVSNSLSTLGNVIANGFTNGINFIKNLPSQAYTWGIDFIDGLIRGIRAMISKVEDAVIGVANKIRSFLHFSVPDEGPLTDYETWMPDFMEGLAKGINNSKHLVTNAIKGLSTDMSVGVSLNPASLSKSSKESNFDTTQVLNSTNMIVVPVNLEGQTIATVTAPYSDRISGRNMNLISRGLIV